MAPPNFGKPPHGFRTYGDLRFEVGKPLGVVTLLSGVVELQVRFYTTEVFCNVPSYSYSLHSCWKEPFIEPLSKP